MTDDPLSDVLKLVDARPVMAGRLTASGPWALSFPPPDKIKFFTIAKGSCWLVNQDHPEPLLLETGDVIFHSKRQLFTIFGDLDATPRDVVELFENSPSQRSLQIGDGDDFSMIGGHVQVDPIFSSHLIDLIPPWLHMKASVQDTTGFRWMLEQLVRESDSDLPGSSIAATQLAQLLFIQLLRLHLASKKSIAPGLLRALGDQKIAPALRLMHHQPGHPWQLEELAKTAGMSRTSFAVHFKAVAGISPLGYLTEWRMQLAQKRLREGDVSVSTLADSLGYASESALSHAFKRVTGMAPKHYRSMAITI